MTTEKEAPPRKLTIAGIVKEIRRTEEFELVILKDHTEENHHPGFVERGYRVAEHLVGAMKLGDVIFFYSDGTQAALAADAIAVLPELLDVVSGAEDDLEDIFEFGDFTPEDIEVIKSATKVSDPVYLASGLDTTEVERQVLQMEVKRTLDENFPGLDIDCEIRLV